MIFEKYKEVGNWVGWGGEGFELSKTSLEKGKRSGREGE